MNAPRYNHIMKTQSLSFIIGLIIGIGAHTAFSPTPHPNSTWKDTFWRKADTGAQVMSEPDAQGFIVCEFPYIGESGIGTNWVNPDGTLGFRIRTNDLKFQYLQHHLAQPSLP